MYSDKAVGITSGTLTGKDIFDLGGANMYDTKIWDDWFNQQPKVYTVPSSSVTYTLSVPKPVSPFDIKQVIFSNPATIVYWKDGTKTVVKCQNNDVFSEEVGLAMAFMKKALGNKGSFNNVLHEWCPSTKVEVDIDEPDTPFE